MNLTISSKLQVINGVKGLPVDKMIKAISEKAKENSEKIIKKSSSL